MTLNANNLRSDLTIDYSLSLTTRFFCNFGNNFLRVWKYRLFSVLPTFAVFWFNRRCMINKLMRPIMNALLHRYERRTFHSRFLSLVVTSCWLSYSSIATVSTPRQTISNVNTFSNLGNKRTSEISLCFLHTGQSAKSKEPGLVGIRQKCHWIGQEKHKDGRACDGGEWSGSAWSADRGYANVMHAHCWPADTGETDAV